MKGEKEKMCNIQDPEQLRELLIKSGDWSCVKCCARSDDPENLCEPIKAPNTNLFCD